MGCMKCGRDVEEGQLFCETCLEVMKKYPVKPGIAVQLPKRREAPGFRKLSVRRRAPASPEEQLLRVKKRLRAVTILWLATLLLLAATIYPTVEFFAGKSFPLPGQNYTAIPAAESNQP